MPCRHKKDCRCCRECHREEDGCDCGKSHLSCKKNPSPEYEAIKARAKERYNAKREEICANVKKYKNEHKEVVKQWQKEYRQSHSDEYKEYMRQYYEENKDELREKGKEYRAEHHDEIAKQKRRYNEEHRDEILKKQEEYRVTHREELNEQARQYYEDHRDERLQYSVESRRGGNIVTIINHKIRAAIQQDREAKRTINPETYVDLRWVLDHINNTKCPHCPKEMIFTNFEPHDLSQFTINRLINSRSHDKDNCEICCLECNCRKGAEWGHSK